MKPRNETWNPEIQVVKLIHLVVGMIYNGLLPDLVNFSSFSAYFRSLHVAAGASGELSARVTWFSVGRHLKTVWRIDTLAVMTSPVKTNNQLPRNPVGGGYQFGLWGCRGDGWGGRGSVAEERGGSRRNLSSSSWVFLLLQGRSAWWPLRGRRGLLVTPASRSSAGSMQAIHECVCLC